MEEILLLLLVGMIIGYVLKSKPRFLKINGTLTSISIYGLLFLLGVSFGSDSDLLKKLPILGGYAFVLSLLAILGSVILAAILYVKLFKKMEKSDEK